MTTTMEVSTVPLHEAIDEPRFLTRREVARLFGVSNSTVTRWAQKGLLKTVRTPGGHYRFPAGETRHAAARAGSMDVVHLD